MYLNAVLPRGFYCHTLYIGFVFYYSYPNVVSVSSHCFSCSPISDFIGWKMKLTSWPHSTRQKNPERFYFKCSLTLLTAAESMPGFSVITLNPNMKSEPWTCSFCLIRNVCFLVWKGNDAAAACWPVPLNHPTLAVCQARAEPTESNPFICSAEGSVQIRINPQTLLT